MWTFFKSMLSTDGKVSSNRVCLFVTLIFVLIWHTIAVIKTGAIPDLATGWNTLIGIFVGGSLGGKATEAYKAKAENQAPEAQQ